MLQFDVMNAKDDYILGPTHRDLLSVVEPVAVLGGVDMFHARMLDGVIVESELLTVPTAVVREVGLQRRVGEFVPREVVGIHVVLIVEGVDILHDFRRFGMEAAEAKRERCEAERKENHRSGGGKEPGAAIGRGEDHGGCYEEGDGDDHHEAREEFAEDFLEGAAGEGGPADEGDEGGPD